MSLIDPSDPRPVHFMGAAGAGMSALAELLVRRGARVTGCDANPAGAPDLARLDVPVAAGHDAAHVAGIRALVVTSAVPQSHPEVQAARAQGIPVIRRAEALAQAVSAESSALIAVAGTHGKTTTSVMTTEALAAAGLEPTGVIGGRVPSWGGNLRFGKADVFVVEADEYDRSFLALAPTVAVVTNLEADHLDIYADLADIKGAFAQFVRGARTIILCADDPGANALELPPGADVVRYGISSPNATLVAGTLSLGADGSAFTVVRAGRPLGDVELRVPGRHNVLNALAAIAAGVAVGATVPEMAPGLRAFGGVERRFQRLGEAKGVTVVDDYAHHPTEIRATLAAARSAFPGRRLVAAFQPHLYTRTRDFAADFGAALAGADAIFLTDIYPAREQPIPGVSATLIADAARAAGGALAWHGTRTDLAAALAKSVGSGDVVLTLGAGDITRTGRELLEKLTAA